MTCVKFNENIFFVVVWKKSGITELLKSDSGDGVKNELLHSICGIIS